METNSETHKWLNDFRRTSGKEFQCNEEAIEQEITQHDAFFSSIGIKILSLLGGITAGTLFLAFLFLCDLFNSEGTIMTLGILFLSASVYISRVSKSVVYDTLTVCLYILGATLLGLGIESFSALWVFIVVACVTLFVSTNYILIFLAVLLFSGSVGGLMLEHEVQWLLTALAGGLSATFMALYCNEARCISVSVDCNRLFRPVTAGLFVSLAVCLIALALIPKEKGDDWAVVLLSLCFWVQNMLMVRHIISALKVTNIWIYVAATLVLLPTLYAPPISGAVLMILLSFRFGYRPALAMSILLLTYLLIQYYYNLEYTLLTKSGMLFVSGILFLALWRMFRKYIKHDDI
jgi:hypothetical protein